MLIFNLATCYIWSIDLHGTKTWTLWRVDQEDFNTFVVCCWRRM